MLRRRAGKKHTGHPVSPRRFLVENLESRRLLSGVAFGTPVSTSLPSGFVPDKCFPAYFLGGDANLNSFVLTSKAGDALLLQGQTDGTFTVLQDLHPSGTVLGVGQGILGNNEVGTIITTTGVMAKQSDGQFAMAASLNYPSDAVPGNYMLDAGLDRDGGMQGDFIVERFKPSAGDPTHGDVILAVFRQHLDGPGTLQYDPEIDSTIATNVTKPAPNEPIISPSSSAGYISVDNVAALDSTYINSGYATFTAGSSLGMTPDELASPRYRADLVNQLEGLSVTNVALFPAAPAPGAQDSSFDAVQFFTPNASGGLSRGARADIAPRGTTAGPLIVGDFTKDGPTDLATAVVSGPDAPSVAIVPGGSAGYLDPVYVPLRGVTAVVAHHFEVPDLICLTANPQPDGTEGYAIVTLPNTSGDGPVAELKASSNALYVGQPLTLTARISTQAFTDSTPGVAPAVELYDGATAVARAPLDVNNFATFNVSTLAAGTHTFTVQPYGYTPADSSPPVTITVRAVPPGGLISASAFQVKAAGVLVPGDSEPFAVHLSNLGNSTAHGAAAISLFASPATTITSDAIQIASDPHVLVSLAKGQGRDVAGTFVIPQSLAPGTYHLIAEVTSSAGNSGTVVLGQTLVDSSPTTVAWEFGRVGNRSNVTFVQHLTAKDTVTYALTGAGTGIVSLHDSSLTLENGDAGYSVSVSSTNTKSKLTISQKGSTNSNILDLTLNADIGSVDVRTDTPSNILTGPVDSSGNSTGNVLVKVKELSVGSPNYAVTASHQGQNALININGSLGKLVAGALALTTINIGPRSTSAVQMDIASIANGTNINSSVPISSFTIKSAIGASTITAPSIGKLKSTGNFSASLNLTGAISGALTLGSADIANVAGSTYLSNDKPLWTINGETGDIRIRGSVADLTLLDGAEAGAGGVLSAPPAAYKAATIRSLTVNGSVSSCIFAAGLDPVDGTVANGNDLLLAGGSFGSISVLGDLDQRSKIVASKLPKFAKVGGQKVSTASDYRFSLNRFF